MITRLRKDRMTNTCRECGAVLAHADDFCSAACEAMFADDRRRARRWTPEAERLADRIAESQNHRDWTRCSECARELPPRTGRGRPRVTCSSPCSVRRKRRMDAAQHAHRRAALMTHPDGLGHPMVRYRDAVTGDPREAPLPVIELDDVVPGVPQMPTWLLQEIRDADLAMERRARRRRRREQLAAEIRERVAELVRIERELDAIVPMTDF